MLAHNEQQSERNCSNLSNKIRLLSIGRRHFSIIKYRSWDKNNTKIRTGIILGYAGETAARLCGEQYQAQRDVGIKRPRLTQAEKDYFKSGEFSYRVLFIGDEKDSPRTSLYFEDGGRKWRLDGTEDVEWRYIVSIKRPRLEWLMKRDDWVGHRASEVYRDKVFQIV